MPDPLRQQIRATSSLGINNILDAILDRVERVGEHEHELRERVTVLETRLADAQATLRATREAVSDYACEVQGGDMLPEDAAQQLIEAMFNG